MRNLGGAIVVRLYPRAWRARYGAELLDLLETRPPDRAAWMDLVRGALDAHLHPGLPARVPTATAIVAGIAWIAAAAVSLAEPVLPDWPGFLVWTLPLGLLGAITGLAVTLAIGRRAGDRGTTRGDAALAMAVVGHLAWIVTLAVALVGGPYGAVTGAAGSLAAVGLAAVGLVRWSAGDHPVAEATLVTAAALLVPSPWAWLAVGACWLALASIGHLERAAGTGRPVWS
jgi:hypothetical protein